MFKLTWWRLIWSRVSYHVQHGGACFGVGRHVTFNMTGHVLEKAVMLSQHDEFALEEDVMLGRT